MSVPPGRSKKHLQARNQRGAQRAGDPRPSAKGAKGPLSFAGERKYIQARNKIKIVRLTQSLRLYCTNKLGNSQ